MFQSSLQEEVSRLKTKVATLQLDLDNSEAVQRDFVKLSQSLQVGTGMTGAQRIRKLAGDCS